MKRTFKMALIASLAVGGSYVLYGSQNKEELSDLALSNVEALTLGTKDCMYQRNSRCYELVVGVLRANLLLLKQVRKRIG